MKRPQSNLKPSNTQASTMMQVLLAVCILYAAVPAIAAELVQPHYRVGVDDNGSVHFNTPDGATRLTLRGYELQSKPALKTGRATVREAADGDRTGLRIKYALTGERAAEFSAESLILPRADGIDVQLIVTGPEKEDLRQARLIRSEAANAQWAPELPLGRWQRQEAGYGVPYEVHDGLMMTYSWADLSDRAVRLILPPPTNAWMKELHWAQNDFYYTAAPNIPLQSVTSGRYEGSFNILLTARDLDSKAARARAARRPVSISQQKTQRFNLWSGADQRVAFPVRVTNTSDGQQPVEIKWIARDFDGAIVHQFAEIVVLKSMETQVRSTQMPLMARDLLFVECSASAENQTDFFRTTITSMPSFEFSQKDSAFGISASWYGPEDAQGVALMKRLGIRWLRHGNANLWRQHGINVMLHNDSPPGRLTTPEERDKLIRSSLDRCARDGNQYWEFANEWNLIKPGIGKTTQYAESYAKDWLAPIYKIRQETGSKVVLLSQGIAGPDVHFIQAIADAGAWNQFDILAMHFGAGQFTADFAPPENEIGYPQDKKQHYWSLLGPLRQVKKLNERLGAKPIWLTELYAPTGPRTGATYRQAAEMILMSYMMILSEGVEKAFIYQLNDGVWFSRFGVNPNDREFHFGLLNRDESLKPSAMAYATAAENLTDATFVRWLTFKDPLIRGVLFNTPRGPLASLWYRGDGYQLYAYKPISVSPEAWENGRNRTTQIDLRADSTVRMLDAIGRTKMIEPKNGTIRLQLDTSPILLYGLDAKQF